MVIHRGLSIDPCPLTDYGSHTDVTYKLSITHCFLFSEWKLALKETSSLWNRARHKDRWPRQRTSTNLLCKMITCNFKLSRNKGLIIHKVNHKEIWPNIWSFLAHGLWLYSGLLLRILLLCRASAGITRITTIEKAPIWGCKWSASCEHSLKMTTTLSALLISRPVNFDTKRKKVFWNIPFHSEFEFNNLIKKNKELMQVIKQIN